MVSAKIETGGLEVIDTGIITAYKENSINITLQSDHKDEVEELEFEFEFLENDDDDVRMETSTLDDTTVKFTIYNHQDRGVSIGGTTPPIGPLEPMEIGSFGGRELFLIYEISTRGGYDDKPRATNFQYTFYLGGEINVAEN